MLSTESFVQDRTIYEDVEIFAKNLFEMNLMEERDYTNYKALFAEMVSYLRPPGLLIYLRAKVPTLVRQIQKRGRDYENTIRIDYLERLNKHYEDWIDRYPHPKLIIETDDLDFVNQPEDLGVILDLIDKRLFSLFP
jgi:deoxyadenosine/deoxycytidine kinase